ncbi:hypothetical protein PBY51_022183 [Eleginops maclovinus]|uniref:Uncharacterized protein n=1 Tax=Eleginops maclovinus TaxID=56733 RepID=A0AAN7XH01_ELEMC|nr:hypothetical protein PBY51_022183 [Eleginops maclovinus]
MLISLLMSHVQKRPPPHPSKGPNANTYTFDGLSQVSFLTAATASSSAINTQPSDVVAALTTALTTALMNVHGPTPFPREGQLKVGCYDGLTSWETYWAQFYLLREQSS